jgi:hypothetical protein
MESGFKKIQRLPRYKLAAGGDQSRWIGCYMGSVFVNAMNGSEDKRGPATGKIGKQSIMGDLPRTVRGPYNAANGGWVKSSMSSKMG